jgi:hypothetical protein
MDGVYELIDKTARSAGVVVRDDQYEFAEIIDAAKTARSRGRRLNFLDTGRFSVTELEWLAEAGVRFSTSDGTRPSAADLRLVRDACAHSGASIALLVNGDIAEEAEPGRLSLSDFHDLAAMGIVLHVSNRERPRDPAVLESLAAAGRLVYYHHGAPVPELAGAAGRGARLHFSDACVDEGDSETMAAILAASRSGRGRIYIHIEKGLPLAILRRLIEGGAKLLFKTPPSDSQSLLRPIERKAAKSRPDPADYYLHTTFLM